MTHVRRPVVCFDLDGTLAEYHGWTGLTDIGKPLTRGVNLLKEVSKFARIIVFTCRNNPRLNSGLSQAELTKFITEWLIKNELPFDEVYEGEGKPVADAYVDDRAVEFNGRSNVAYAIAKIKNLI